MQDYLGCADWLGARLFDHIIQTEDGLLRLLYRLLSSFGLIYWDPCATRLLPWGLGVRCALATRSFVILRAKGLKEHQAVTETRSVCQLVLKSAWGSGERDSCRDLHGHTLFGRRLLDVKKGSRMGASKLAALHAAFRTHEGAQQDTEILVKANLYGMQASGKAMMTFIIPISPYQP